MEKPEIIELKELKEYKLSKKLSALAWDILLTMDDENRRLLGGPFVKAVDGVGANIALGFNQINIDNKFKYYVKSNSALTEAINHWSELMLKRHVISKVTYNVIKDLEKPLRLKLKKFISSSIKNETK
jgi:tRNA U34 5-carboxymethylaminomethyl modifying enzyme MnmG/GidA